MEQEKNINPDKDQRLAQDNASSYQDERLNFLSEEIDKNIINSFTENELRFIIDAHEGTDFDQKINFTPKLFRLRIMETENLDGLVAKWNVDELMVIDKARGLSNDEVAALVKWSCRYWTGL